MGFSRKRVVKILSLIGVVFLCLNVEALANNDILKAGPRKFFIDVGAATTRFEKLYIDPIEVSNEHFKNFIQVIADDLNFSDYVEVVPFKNTFSATSVNQYTKSDRLKHRVLGSTIVLKVHLDVKSSKVLAAIFNARSAELIKSSELKYKGSLTKKSIRRLSHWVSDFVIEGLTGEEGIYQSKMLMSCGKKLKEIYIADYDGHFPVRLTHDKNIALAPSWNLDGDRILFTSFKPIKKGLAQNPNLYMVNLKSRKRKLISATRGLNTGGVYHPFQNLIAYTHSKRGKAEVFLLDMLSKSRKVITKSFYFSVEPSWSPKGDRITFSSSASGRPHIYVSDKSGSSPKRLTFAGHYNSSPNWSPVSDKIVFSGQENKKNNFNIFVVDASGSNLQRLTQGRSSNENPHFSPNGRFVSFASNREGVYKIYAMSLKKLKPRLITPEGVGECKDPAWSPARVAAF